MIRGRHAYSMFQMQQGSPGGSACTIGTERVVLCDSLLYLQMIEC